MLRILAIILTSLALAGCSTSGIAVRTGLESLSPALAGPTGPMQMIAQGPAGKDGKSSRKAKKAGTGGYPDTKTVSALPVDVIQPPEADFTGARSISMVPASGDQRTRLVRSASRLVGIRKSFDSRSFLGHLLAICDLLPDGRTSTGWTSSDQMALARSAGTFREPSGPAQPGDIVFFKCAAECGADAKDGIGVGVVVTADDTDVSVIAYKGGLVEQFQIEKGGGLTGYTAP